MKIEKWMRRNRVMTVLIAVGFLVLIAQYNSIQRKIEMSSNIRDKISTSSYEAMLLKVSKDDADRKAAIAKHRYESGCLVPLSKTDRTKYASIVEGMIVYGSSDQPLAVNSLVCDKDGNTGIITLVKNKPVITEIAYTGDWEVINKARKFNVAIYATRGN
jgi:hypothetical protein